VRKEGIQYLFLHRIVQSLFDGTTSMGRKRGISHLKILIRRHLTIPFKDVQLPSPKGSNQNVDDATEASKKT